MPSTSRGNNKKLAFSSQNDNYLLGRRIKSNIDILRQFKQGNLDSVKQYSGFGGLRSAFKQESLQAMLAELLSPEELDRLRKSTSTGGISRLIF